MKKTSSKATLPGFRITLAVTTALASVAISGCTTTSAPQAELSFSKAQVALQKGQSTKAIKHAEAAVLAEPRNASFRALLGAAYMENGRFQSAATSFSDALDLGDQDPRTVLSYALSQIALGKNQAAIGVLEEWRDDIDPADLGLAFALAGNPNRGVHILGNALRGGENTAKMRQNLAYSYALQGNWRAARVMAAEDVPADQVSDRISQWAQSIAPEDYQRRVAGLLQVTPIADSGQPSMLALANYPAQAQMVAEAAAQAPAADAAEPAPMAPQAEQLAVNAPAATAEKVPSQPLAMLPPSYRAALEPSQHVASTTSENDLLHAGPRFISREIVQPLPADYVSARRIAAKSPAATRPSSRIARSSSQRRMASTAANPDGSHLVQLGSFLSRQHAERAIAIYHKRYAQLSSNQMVITKARVRGETYYRVSAAGFGSSSALSMCHMVNSMGYGCIAYAKNRPLPGSLDQTIRVASL